MTFVVHYRNKVARIRQCERCDGRGFFSFDNWINFGHGKVNLGRTFICGCNGGYRVDYPWTRGKSMVPLITRSAKRSAFAGLFS